MPSRPTPVPGASPSPLVASSSTAVARGILRTERASWPAAVLSLFALLVGASGCGHPASETECQAILDRIVDLELKAQRVTDPAEIAKRRKESLGLGGNAGDKNAILQGCLGKHITERAISCVRAAETSAEITDRCLQ